MNHRPCRFIGQHHREHLLDRVETTLREWSLHWAGEVHTHCDEIKPVEMTDGLDGPWAQLSNRDGIDLWLQFASGGPADLIELFSGGGGSCAESSEFAEELGFKLLDDWRQRLILQPASGKTELQTGVNIPADISAKWSGAVLARFSVSAAQVRCVLSPDLVRRIVPEMPGSKIKPRSIGRLNDAVRGTGTSLDVRIRAADGLSLGMFSQLTEGSVVILGLPPQALWTLYSPDGGALARCRIGRRESRYAIQVSDNKPDGARP